MAHWNEEQYEAIIHELETERDALREFVSDVADHGLRCDLTPTMRLKDKEQIYTDMANYLQRQDSTLRERAQKVLHASS